MQVTTFAPKHAPAPRVGSAISQSLGQSFGDSFVPSLDDARVEDAILHLKSGSPIRLCQDHFGKNWNVAPPSAEGKIAFRLGDDRQGQLLEFKTAGDFEVSLTAAAQCGSSWQKETFVIAGDRPKPAVSDEARYRELLDEERAKPGWEDSQARQAWLHWG